MNGYFADAGTVAMSDVELTRQKLEYEAILEIDPDHDDAISGLVACNDEAAHRRRNRAPKVETPAPYARLVLKYLGEHLTIFVVLFDGQDNFLGFRVGVLISQDPTILDEPYREVLETMIYTGMGDPISAWAEFGGTDVWPEAK